LANQSFSADAHNLYAKGYKKASGLILVEPRCIHIGRIILQWNNFDTF